MENEDYRIITLHDNKLKVYRDGRIEKEFVYKYGSRDKKYKKGDIKWIDVGTLHESTGYYRFELNYKNYLSHRIMAYAFLGLDFNNPDEIIDHIDNNRSNNNFNNLRIVTYQQNSFNRKDTKGYCWKKSRNKYEASICVNQKTIFLGLYKTEVAARYAYLVAKNHYHEF